MRIVLAYPSSAPELLDEFLQVAYGSDMQSPFFLPTSFHYGIGWRQGPDIHDILF